MRQVPVLLGEAAPTAVVGWTVCPPGGALLGYEWAERDPAHFITPFKSIEETSSNHLMGFKNLPSISFVITITEWMVFTFIVS